MTLAEAKASLRVDHDFEDALISLPANLFYGTGISAAILLFRKDKRDRRQKPDKSVLFIDASREDDDVKTQNRLAGDHIEKIVATYKARSEVDQYADFDEIRENDFNLNIPRYVDTFEEETLPQTIISELPTRLASWPPMLIPAQNSFNCFGSGSGRWNWLQSSGGNF